MSDEVNGWITNAAMCMECGRVWQAVFEEGTPMDQLQCPNCGAQQSVAMDNYSGLI